MLQKHIKAKKTHKSIESDEQSNLSEDRIAQLKQKINDITIKKKSSVVFSPHPHSDPVSLPPNKRLSFQ